MEVKAGYKQTEIGVIPEEWTNCSFADLFQFKNGVNAGKEAYGQGVPFINVLEVITQPYLDRSQIPGRVTLTKPLLSLYAVFKGDILFNRTSETQEEVGLASVYQGEDLVVFGGFVIRGRLKSDQIDSQYAGYGLRSPTVRTQIIARGQGAIRANIGQKDLYSVVVPLPPLPEQKAIAAALSDTDASLRALDKLLAKKRDIKQAAMQQLLMGKTRLPWFAGEWQEKPLSELAWATKGTQLDSAKTSSTGTFAHLNGGINPSGYTENANTNANTIAISEGGNSCGYVQFMAEPYWCGGHCYSVVPKGIDNRFLYHALKAKQSSIMEMRVGSGLPNIQKSALLAFHLCYPNAAEEQAAIAAVLSDMDAEITAVQQTRDKTRAVRQGMMQELLTGRTRLV